MTKETEPISVENLPKGYHLEVQLSDEDVKRLTTRDAEFAAKLYAIEQKLESLEKCLKQALL